MEAILCDTDTEAWIEVTIEERAEETFRQERRGRPNTKTRYVKQERMRFDLAYRVDHALVA